MKFKKYQALGNDYLVLEITDAAGLTPDLIRGICDRHYGVGSDGILLGSRADQESFALRIFNPDGSEAEKSGNGLRIYARYLWDSRLVQEQPFVVRTRGGDVRCQVRDNGAEIIVAMGTASFDSERIPVAGAKRDVINESIEIDGETFTFTAVTVGNPHCVIHLPEISAAHAHRFGPKLEVHPLFINRTNVQFVKVLDRGRIQLEIWERGAGYTLASGSSSCAAAAASVRLGFCDRNIEVLMPGGRLDIEVDETFSLTMIGPARQVTEGVISSEMLEDAVRRKA